MNAPAHVVALLRLLQGGFDTFRPDDATVAVWSEELAAYSPERLAEAGRKILRLHRFGNPRLPVVFEALEGRKVAAPTYQTDVWGRRVLGSDGTPRIVGYEEAVIPYGEALPEGARELGQGSTAGLLTEGGG